MDDLTQRLRDARVKAPMQASYTGLDGKPLDVAVMQPDPLAAEAAARIEALEAEVARLRDGHDEIVRQFGGIKNGHIAATISRAALGDEAAQAIAAEIRQHRAALTPPHVQHTAGVVGQG